MCPDGVGGVNPTITLPYISISSYKGLTRARRRARRAKETRCISGAVRRPGALCCAPDPHTHIHMAVSVMPHIRGRRGPIARLRQGVVRVSSSVSVCSLGMFSSQRAVLCCVGCDRAGEADLVHCGL